MDQVFFEIPQVVFNSLNLVLCDFVVCAVGQYFISLRNFFMKLVERRLVLLNLGN